MAENISLAKEYVLSRLSRAVSERLGIVRATRELALAADDLPVHVRGVAFFENFRLNSTLSAAGAGIDPDSASIAALSEALERYSSMSTPRKIVARSTTGRELRAQGKALLDKQAFEFYSDAQYQRDGFPFERFDEGKAYDWIEATRLADGSPVLLPSSLIVRTSPRLCENNTNGMACRDTPEGACLYAFLELIERDAFLLAWWTQKIPRRLRPLQHSKNPRVRELISRLRLHLHRVQIAVAQNESGIPVLIAGRWGEPSAGDPAFVVSAACALDPVRALEKTLTELGQCLHYSRSLVAQGYKTSIAPHFDQSIRSFDDGIAFYFDAEQARAVDFLFASQDLVDIDDLPDLSAADEKTELHFLIDRMLAASWDPIAIDRTPRDVQSIGFYVYKAFVPGLIPLNSTHRARGWGSARLPRTGLNHLPHPFP